MSLNPTFAQIYSEQRLLQPAIDSVQAAWLRETPFHKIDSLLTVFHQRIDSLKKNIKDPTYYLVAVQDQYAELSERLNDMNFPPKLMASKINTIDSILSEKQSRIDSLLQKAGLPDFNIDLNSMAEGKISNVPSLDKINGKLPALPELQNHFPDSELTFPNPISTNLEIPKLEISTLSNSNSSNIENASEAMVKKLQPVNELIKSQERVESLFKEADAYSKTLQDPNALQEKAKEEFIDHFEGKEEIVKKDLEDIARLQTKYRDIADSRLLPKHPWKVSAMKNKPFIERLVPGIDLQVLTENNISVNVAPSITYKLSGVFQSGVSAFKRVTYFKKQGSLRFIDCYGFRFFAQAKVYKSFHLYWEFQRHKPDLTSSNTSTLTIAQSPENQGLQNKVNLGVWHSYAIGKNIKGYFVILYDIVQFKKFPNSTGSSARFGFQYEWKKKKK